MIHKKKIAALFTVLCISTASAAIAGCSIFGQKKDTVEKNSASDDSSTDITITEYDKGDIAGIFLNNMDISRHNYNWSCLTNDDSGISYEGDERYYIRKGIDVSSHQEEIDWKAVKEDGIEFAFIRIAYRGYSDDGVLLPDEYGLENIRKAKKEGIDVGVYVFSQAINEEEAAQEAQYAIDLLAGTGLELPIVYDPETISDDTARTDDLNADQITKNTIAFCEKVRESGYDPAIYSNLKWEVLYFNMEKLKDYDFWYADYNSEPKTPCAFRFWQYSKNGTVNGVKGKTDMNVEFIAK